MASVRVLLVAGHTLFRQGVRCLLAQGHGIRVVGEAGNGRQAAMLTNALLPDVLVIEPSLPDGDGWEVVRAVRRSHPKVRVVVMCLGQDEEQEARARACGAHVCLGPRADAATLLQELQPAGGRGSRPSGSRSKKVAAPAGPVASGHEETRADVEAAAGGEFEALFGPASAARSRPAGITPAEQRVLEALGRGLSNQEIAQLLGLRVTTVKAHLRRLYQKLRVKNRTQAVLALRQHPLP